MADNTKGSIRRWRAGTSSGGDLALTKPDSLNPSGYNNALYLAGLKEGERSDTNGCPKITFFHSL